MHFQLHKSGNADKLMNCAIPKCIAQQQQNTGG